MEKQLKIALSVAAVVTAALSVASIIGVGFAGKGPIVYKHEGKEYRAIPIEGLHSNAIASTSETARSLKDQNMTEEREKVKNVVKSFVEDFGGIYINENGDNVYLLKSKDGGLEKKIKEINPNAKVSYVRFSETELDKIEADLKEKSNLGVQFAVKNVQTNNVEVYLSQESYDKNKNELLKNMDSAAVRFVIGAFILEDQSATIFPGEQIDRKTSTSTYECSMAFDAIKDSSNVSVTAGHCGNGTYYDLSDDTINSIGSMNDATNAGKVDAGSVILNSGVGVSSYLSGNSMTIGTFDYNGARQAVGNYVYLHATSGNGSSYIATIKNSSYSINGFMDMAVTSPAGASSGDSGGLWYSTIVKNNKTYAVIEGVHKGVLKDSNGNVIYAIYSKLANVYDGLGLGGIYVDANY